MSFQDNGRNTSHILVPDYGKEPLAVFGDVARYCIQESGQLTILGRGGIPISGDWSSCSYKSGPSWVPRWDIPSQMVLAKGILRPCDIVLKDDAQTYEEPEMFRAAAALSAQVMDTQDTSQLCLQGVKVDTISWSSAVGSRKCFERSTTSPLMGVWDSVLNYFTTTGLRTLNRPLDQLCRAFYMVVCAGQTPEDSMASDEPLCNFWAYLTDCYKAQAPEHPMYKVYEELAAGGDFMRVLGTVAEKKIFVGSLGHIGQGPPMLQLNDEIWVLYGGATCHVLRNNGDGTRAFIDEAYVHGLMQGEAIQMLKDGLLEETTVTLV